MSAADALTSLARGKRPPDDGLLGNCRMEWGGGEAYGEEAILESFRNDPLDIAAGTLIARDQGLVWLGEGSALAADLYDGRIGRLWRIGPGKAPEPEPAVAVAFDPDLSQQRGGVVFAASDHSELDTTDALLGAVATLIESDQAAALHRARAFVVRALSSGNGAAVLCAVHRLGGGAVRTSGFGYAVAAVEPGGATRIVIDQARAIDWTPRL